MENADDHLEKNIGQSLKALRLQRAMTLDQLATASGVSRAMISKVERGEASPTAVLLARLLTPLDETLSGFFSATEETVRPVSRRAEQRLWRDPETGYVRRAVSPRGHPMNVDLVEVDLPAGARVTLPPMQFNPPQMQYVWLLEGELTMESDGARHDLNIGDCLFMGLADGITFHNRSAQPCRYAVILKKG